MTLLTMVPHNSTVPPHTCSTPAEFGYSGPSLQMAEIGAVHFLQAHPFSVMSLLGVLLVAGLLVWKFKQRRREEEGNRENKIRTCEQEFQGLLRDYEEFDYDRNLKKK